MKDLNLLVFITQLGLSVAAPLGGCVWLGFFLRQRFGLGRWIVLVLGLIGLISAVQGFRYTLRGMERLSGQKKKEPPPVSFNEHE